MADGHWPCIRPCFCYCHYCRPCFCRYIAVAISFRVAAVVFVVVTVAIVFVIVVLPALVNTASSKDLETKPPILLPPTEKVIR